MSQQEKILIISPQLPAYDQASGDLRLFTIIKILSENYKVFYLDTQKWGASDRKYKEALEELGVTVYTKETPLTNIFEKNFFKSVIIEFYHIAAYYLPRIRILQPGCPVIMDSVDIHFYREKLKYDLTRDKNDLRKAMTTKKEELALYKKADLVIAVTQEDAEVVKREDPSIPFGIIPNIHTIVDTRVDTRDRNTLVFIGSFKHQPNIDAISYFCREVFPLILKKQPQIQLQIIGSGAPDHLLEMADDHVKFLGFVPSVTPYLQNSYISIAPLRYGAGMKGKIGEAMAHGLPVVTTSIGVQGMNLKHKENILVGDTPEQFAQCICELMSDEHLHNKIAVNSIEYIKANFIPEKIRPGIFKIIQELESHKVKQISIKEGISFLFEYISGRMINISKRIRSVYWA